MERHLDIEQLGFDAIDAQRAARNALGGDVHLGVGTADHLRQKEDAVHINLGSDLDAGRILDVARQQRLRHGSLPWCPRPTGATQQRRSGQAPEGGGAGVPAIDHVVVASSQPSLDSVPFIAGCRSPRVIRRLGQLARWPSTVSSAGVSTGRTIRVSIISPTVTAKAI